MGFGWATTSVGGARIFASSWTTTMLEEHDIRRPAGQRPKGSWMAVGQRLGGNGGGSGVTRPSGIRPTRLHAHPAKTVGRAP